jgi:hypothetical protein
VREDLGTVTQLEVELEVTYARRAKYEAFTHQLHADHATGVGGGVSSEAG